MINSLKDKDTTVRTALLLALVNLVLLGILGCTLRLQPIWPFPGFHFKYWVHAHSHTAFMGWVFMTLVALIYKHHMPDNAALNKKMGWLVVTFQVAVLGMICTFPFTGYAAGSIFFTTVHMFASFYFVLLFLKNNRKQHGLPLAYLRHAFFFMVLSGAGPLALGPIAALGFKSTPWYDGAIYFYLHFQYNGWFALAIIGLLLGRLSELRIGLNERSAGRCLWLWSAGIALSFGLSVLGFGVPVWVNVISIAGAAMQLLAISWIFGLFWQNRKVMGLFRLDSGGLLMLLGLMALLIKGVAQLVSGFPAMLDVVYHNHDVIIGYLHLVLLGFVSMVLIGMLAREGLFRNIRLFRSAAVAFVIGVAGNEMLLFSMGIFYRYLQAWAIAIFWQLLFVSVLMTVSFGMFLISARPDRFQKPARPD